MNYSDLILGLLEVVFFMAIIVSMAVGLGKLISKD